MPSSEPGRRRWSIVVILVLLGSLLVGCGKGTVGYGSTAGILRIAMTAGNIPFPSTPPDQGYEGYRFVGNNIYDGLTRFNLDQSKTIPTPQPALAKSWSISPDKLTWTFHLRRGVTFQDGTPFNADAVLFQFNRMLDKKFTYYDTIDAPRYAASFLQFKSWHKIDDYTVSVTTKHPYAWLSYDLASVYFPSPAVVKKYGNTNYNAHAIGTGPFTIKKYVDGQVMILQANDHYWRGRPKLNEIVLYPMPEAATRLSALESGEVDWAEVPSPDALSQLKDDGYVTYMGKYPHGIMPRFNLFRKPFKGNIKLRKALNYALDRVGTADLINNVGYPAKQYVYPGHPDYAPDNPGYHYDPAEARRLLAEAGYKPGQLHLNMAYPTGGSGNMFPDIMMQKLQADFTAIGVEVTLEPMEWDTLTTISLATLKSPQWKNIDILWSSPAAGMIPTGYATTFQCMQSADTPNASGICNKQMQADYQKASSSFDPKTSHKYLQDMMNIAVNDAYFLFWMHDLNLRVMSPKVHGFVEPKSWWVDFDNITVGG